MSIPVRFAQKIVLAHKVLKPVGKFVRDIYL